MQTEIEKGNEKCERETVGQHKNQIWIKKE